MSSLPGSTVPYVVERIVQQGWEANKNRTFIPTGMPFFVLPIQRVIPIIGFQSKELIVGSGLTLGDVDQYPTIDITLDGADE